VAQEEEGEAGNQIARNSEAAGADEDIKIGGWDSPGLTNIPTRKQIIFVT
jgi:hypothetical protein